MKTEEQLNQLQATLESFRQCLPTVQAVGAEIAQCLQAGGKLLTCGNGGSATDALHLSEELVGRYNGDRRALASICLCADVSALTCIGNDYGYDALFARQVEALGQSGDVLVAFTTSGNSANVLRAFEAAQAHGLITVLVSGKGGGEAAGICDFEIIVPSQTTARIQEVHTLVMHQWLEIVEAELFPDLYR